MPKKGMSRMARSRVLRRNTMDCALLNEMFVNEEKRNDKKLQSLLRDSERELKNSLTGLPNFGANGRIGSFHETGLLDLESVDECTPLNSEILTMRHSPKVVESYNRYMCVSSRPSGCRLSAPASAFLSNTMRLDIKKASPAQTRRKDFHDTFANLIKLGNIDRQETKVIFKIFYFFYFSSSVWFAFV